LFKDYYKNSANPLHFLVELLSHRTIKQDAKEIPISKEVIGFTANSETESERMWTVYGGP